MSLIFTYITYLCFEACQNFPIEIQWTGSRERGLQINKGYYPVTIV